MADTVKLSLIVFTAQGRQTAPIHQAAATAIVTFHPAIPQLFLKHVHRVSVARLPTRLSVVGVAHSVRRFPLWQLREALRARVRRRAPTRIRVLPQRKTHTLQSQHALGLRTRVDRSAELRQFCSKDRRTIPPEHLPTSLPVVPCHRLITPIQKGARALVSFDAILRSQRLMSFQIIIDLLQASIVLVVPEVVERSHLTPLLQHGALPKLARRNPHVISRIPMHLPPPLHRAISGNPPQRARPLTLQKPFQRRLWDLTRHETMARAPLVFSTKRIALHGESRTLSTEALVERARTAALFVDNRRSEPLPGIRVRQETNPLRTPRQRKSKLCILITR